MSRLTGAEAYGLMEAYQAVYAETEQVDENIRDAAIGALNAGAEFMKTNPVGRAISNVLAPVGSGRKTPTKDSGGYRPVVKGVKTEELDLFDYILEYLVAEGYADTNENAIAIMSNMSEEWRQSIVEDVYMGPPIKQEKPQPKVEKKPPASPGRAEGPPASPGRAEGGTGLPPGQVPPNVKKYASGG